MSDAAYVSAIQGRPWSPEQHCWDLCREVQRDLFGRDLPAVVIADKPTALELVRAFHGHPERQNWRETDRRIHGAIALMHRPGAHARAAHAGVYLDLDEGGVLHVDDPHGVTFDSMLDLGVRNWRVEFFVPR